MAMLSLIGCSEEQTTGGSPNGAQTARAADPRPSIVLIVIESLRTDALASYGRDFASPLPLEGRSATPTLDQLAQSGIRYAWAISASPATVTSHASLFTGLEPQEHGAGLWTELAAEDGLETIAETLSAAGYETVGFSENPMVGSSYGLDQGFETFAALSVERVVAGMAELRPATDEFDLLRRVRQWFSRRDVSRPFFLYVNIADPHLPYAVSQENPFLPSEIPLADIPRALGNTPARHAVCEALPTRDVVDLLASLYLGEVLDADRKVAALMNLLSGSSAQQSDPISVITSDHGAHFGEQRLLGHGFAVDNRALHVPLIVTGTAAANEAQGSVVEQMLAQRHIADSVRCWAGLTQSCEDALPTDDENPLNEPIVSVVGNEPVRHPAASVIDSGFTDQRNHYANAYCDPETGLQNRSVAYHQPPFKYIWRATGPASLFDLSWDTPERSDQIERQPEVARDLAATVGALVERSRLDQVHPQPQNHGALTDAAKRAYDAGIEAMVSSQEVATDAVWFAQEIQKLRPAPEVAAWIEKQIPLHANDPYFPIIATDQLSSIPITEEVPPGLTAFGFYLLSALAGPDDLAMQHLSDYIFMKDTEGYILTHQVSALAWAQMLGRPVPEAVAQEMPDLLGRVHAEHREDARFRDLWVERAAFLTLFADVSHEELTSWVETLVEHHLGKGDWGHSGTVVEFNADRQVAEHPRSHIRGMALIVLARYLHDMDETVD